MQHNARWYDCLAIQLGHRGFVTALEVKAAERREADQYTHYVKRASGYVAGWFKGETAEADAEACVAECNRLVPGDPAHVEALDPDEWEPLLAAEMGEPHPTQIVFEGYAGATEETADRMRRGYPR